MRLANTVIGSITILLAAGLLYLSANLASPPFLGRGGLGPAHFPIAIAILMGVLGVLLIWREGWRQGPEATPASPLINLGADARRRLIGVFALFLAYVLLMGWIGYVLGTGLFFVAAIGYVGRFSWKLTVPVGLGLTLLLWVIFSGWLAVPLPEGPWGF